MKALAFALVLLACGAAAAQPMPQLPKKFPWDHRPNKCFLPGGDVPGGGPMCVEPPRWPHYAETKRHVEMVFGEGDFDLAEIAEREVGLSKGRYDTGEYVFHAWFAALDEFTEAWGQRAKDFVQGWGKAKGREGYVPLAEGLIAYHEGWAARGKGYANTVSPEAWAIYSRKLAEADALLDTVSPQVKQLGPWYFAKLRIAFQRQESRPQAVALVKAGTSAWPEYLPLYNISMTFMSPRWGGSFKEMDGVARFALDRTDKAAGAALYALVYERYFRGKGDGQDTLRDSEADWDLLKQGFRDLEKSGKAPPWIWVNFAALACQMRDREEARRLYALHDQRQPGAAASPLDACRSFAMSSQ